MSCLYWIIKCPTHCPVELCSCVYSMCLCRDTVNVSYFGGSIGVDGDHVLNSLFDFELDVELPLQGSNAFLVGWSSALCPRRLRTLICVGKEKVGHDIKRNKIRVHMVCSKMKMLFWGFHARSNNNVAFWISTLARVETWLIIWSYSFPYSYLYSPLLPSPQCEHPVPVAEHAGSPACG